jgi:hypothetical protein
MAKKKSGRVLMDDGDGWIVFGVRWIVVGGHSGRCSVFGGVRTLVKTFDSIVRGRPLSQEERVSR